MNLVVEDPDGADPHLALARSAEAPAAEDEEAGHGVGLRQSLEVSDEVVQAALTLGRLDI
jgi:hypothetical protein